MNISKEQHKTASGKPELPTQFAVGTKVQDIYTGEINTVLKSYWQNYAGAGDYTVEFEPTQEQPTGWNKSCNLREVEPQAEHSPLPWSADKWATGYTVSATDHSVCHLQDCNNDEANAKLIVASVNHAEALAEALRRMIE